jgi:hypothetical protein
MNNVIATNAPLPFAGEQLECRLEELLHHERFAPPAHFVADARFE